MCWESREYVGDIYVCCMLYTVQHILEGDRKHSYFFCQPFALGLLRSLQSRRWRIAHRHAYFPFLRGWPLKTPEAAFVNGVLSAVMINNKIAFFSWKPLAHSLPLQVPNLPETRLRGIIVNNSHSGCRGTVIFDFLRESPYNYYSRPNFSVY